MNEFVTLCARDKTPIIWLQDTTGIDVGDDAEKAELLGLGQSPIYSIENSKLPSLEVTLRKASACCSLRSWWSAGQQHQRILYRYRCLRVLRNAG